MSTPTLPLELQLYIIELAAPLCDMTRRRETLKSCSLVHRSWTATAQRLLFRHLEHYIKSDPYIPSIARIDDERLGALLRNAPPPADKKPSLFTTATIEALHVMPSGRLASILRTDLTKLFPNVKQMLHVGSDITAYLELRAGTTTELFSKIGSFTLIKLRALAPASSPQQSRPSEVWPALERLVLNKARLHLPQISLADWAPGLDIFISHLSSPGLHRATLTALPSSLRIAIFVTSPVNLQGIDPVRLPSTLELLQICILIDLDRRGRVPVHIASSVKCCRASLAVCRGGPNLTVKVETVPTSIKTADELFEEIADRYGLLR